MSTTTRFDQTRKDWAVQADPIVEQCYKTHYDITDQNIHPVETLVDAKHDRENGYDTHQILDYGGLDKFIETDPRTIHISERVRPSDPQYRDLSLRVENAVTGRHEEVTKWKQAVQDHGYYPDIIAFGLYNDDTAILEELYLIDTHTVVTALLNDPPGTVNPNQSDNTKARYISVRQLRDINAIITEWHDVTLASSEDTHRGPTAGHGSVRDCTGVDIEEGQLETQQPWRGSAQDLTEQCLTDYYPVTRADVYDIDTITETSDDQPAATTTRDALTNPGLDTIIDCGTRHVHITTQWQTPYTDHRGVNVCTDTGKDTTPSTLTRWLAAYHTYGYYPDVIAYGIYYPRHDALSEAHLIDTEKLLDALIDTGSGTDLGYTYTDVTNREMRVISIDELRESGAVLESWLAVTAD